MKDLLKNATVTYKYITQKKYQVTTYMTLEPKQKTVENHLKSLGFTLKNEGKKDCIIDLSWKDTSLRHELILAHYSMPISSVFLPESCIATSVTYMQQKGPVKYEDLFEMTKKVYDIFRMEHLYSYPHSLETVKDGVDFFVTECLLAFDDEASFSIVDSVAARSMISFYSSILGPIIDTYRIMLLTIEYMSGKPIVIPVRKLIRELHASIKELYSEGVIPHLHSCLTDILRTALRRYEEAGFIEMRSFANKKGSQRSFFQVLPDKNLEIVETLTLLKNLRKESPGADVKIEYEIINAIDRSTGPV